MPRLPTSSAVTRLGLKVPVPTDKPRLVVVSGKNAGMGVDGVGDQLVATEHVHFRRGDDQSGVDTLGKKGLEEEAEEDRAENVDLLATVC